MGGKMVDVIAEEIQAEMLIYAPRVLSEAEMRELYERVVARNGYQIQDYGRDHEGKLVLHVQRLVDE